ncbi:hypothetical protein jhhlp_003479 [Lomentospora prolificans]|uniref:PAS domain-containing protein n=1 Tax=Lomentospora prolificans TaxID=41688 RepID=A0A2N3N8V2_9PEZI|nr:hypothetical protein jhhlp_003479 [Lomentospora prolificans]
MDQTFMTIHNLSHDAIILFASASVADILGYLPEEIENRSCFDYFHPDEVPFARSVHSRGVLLDKAAVLHYCRIRARDGRWISCECCFTVVHDVLVACTSVYQRGERSERRAIEAPQIRRIFSCSPRDPRYHMLEHLSPRFKMPPMEREPRAALILNRFTRTHTIMFATNAVSTILGLRPDQIKDKSFYECIQENCLTDAVRCLESAKANDSIAYLRFWYRDPRREEDFTADEVDTEARFAEEVVGNSQTMPQAGPRMGFPSRLWEDTSASHTNQHSSSEACPVRPIPQMFPGQLQSNLQNHREQLLNQPISSFELEAVVSCTSDGLVVVLRKARPPIPVAHPPLLPFDFENGLFAAPWGQQSITPCFPPDVLHNFRPPLLPQFMPLRENVKAAGGPPLDQLMKSIRDVAVFAWALVGINENLATYGRGLPTGDSQFPVTHSGLGTPHAEIHPPFDATERPGSLTDVARSTRSRLHEFVMASSSRLDSSRPDNLTDDDLIDPDDADLNDLDDPLATNASTRQPLTGSISSRPLNQTYLTSRIPGEDRRAPQNTIDESVWATLRRDLLGVWGKMREVLYPRHLFIGTVLESAGGFQGAYENLREGGISGARDELAGFAGRVLDTEALLSQGNTPYGVKDWDLWGPLIFCLLLSLLLSFNARADQRDLVFSGVFALVWIGEGVVTLQIKLLGGNISFAQSVCIIGYTLFPLVIASLFSALGLIWIARIPVYLFLVSWSLAAGVSILGGSGVVQNRVGLAVYPLFVFYSGVGCLCFIS